MVLNFALLLAFATMALLFVDKVYEIFKGSRLFLSGDAAPQAFRVSAFITTALVLIVLGFFSWESFVISARERNLLHAEQDLRRSEQRLSRERQEVVQLPGKMEALKRGIQQKGAELDALDALQEIELEAARARVAAEALDRKPVAKEDVAAAEILRDKRLESAEMDVSQAFETLRLEFEANLAVLRAEAKQLEKIIDSDDKAKADYNVVIEVLQSATERRPSLYRNALRDHIDQINSSYEAVILEYRQDQARTDSERLRAEGEISANFELRRNEIVSELAELSSQLENSENRLASSDLVADEMQSEIQLLEKSVERVLANIDTQPLQQSNTDTALAFRALALGALGAMVTLLISHERAQTGRLRSIFSDKDFFTLFISQMVRGSVVAVSGYAIVFTDIVSFGNDPSGSTESIPDFWKMTLVCIALGAFAERIYDLVGAKLPNSGGHENGTQ